MAKADIGQLTQTNAEEIADRWKYPDEYSFYDMTEDVEDYDEIIDSEKRGGCYFQMVENGKLVGFFVLVQDGSSMELGLGMKPELCGRGLGKEFMRTIEDYVVKNYEVDTLNIAVAQFNKRAIKLYHNMGYVDCGIQKINTNGGVYDFINMTKRVK